jgi:hypothetical protein
MTLKPNIMGNPSQADSLNQSSVSENQDKMVDIYFGIFFDAMDMSLAAHYFNREEYLRKGEEKVSEVKDSSIYKTVNEVAAWADFVAETLPDNPVSKAVKKGLEVKNTIESKADNLMGKAGGLSDDIAGLGGKVPTSVSNKEKSDDDSGGESVLGSERSVISKLEPNYIGDYFKTNYNFRIYTVGAVTKKEVKQNKSNNDEAEPELDENTRNQFEKDAIEKVVEAIKQKINPSLPKQSLHFDIFGYTKDPAVNNFIQEIDQFKQNPNVNELSIDFKGLYDNLNSRDEVFSSINEDTMKRFRNLNNL